MSTGLLALLDDVVALTRAAAVSLDDIGAMSAKAGTKSLGVVIDDAAVTPSYAVGLSPARELPIVWRITKGSLRNKLLILLPAALALSAFAPWAITPLLMLGGAFLCFEGAEKLLQYLGHHPHGDHGAAEEQPAAEPPGVREEKRVAGAVRTDLILSAEIMAITLSALPEAPFWQQAVVLALVGTGITALVYGAVALIVKADDVGLAMASAPAENGAGAARQKLGRGIVAAMPGFLSGLAAVGTAAMLWVGGGIILHGLEEFGLGGPAHVVHDLAQGFGETAQLLSGPITWVVGAAGAAVAGTAIGFAVIPLVERVIGPFAARLQGT